MSTDPTDVGGYTRRIVQQPRMARRVSQYLPRAAAEVHRRRVRLWAAMDDGPFPTPAESREIAIRELALLCEALGALVEIDPASIDLALGLNGSPLPRRPGVSPYELP